MLDATPEYRLIITNRRLATNGNPLENILSRVHSITVLFLGLNCNYTDLRPR